MRTFFLIFFGLIVIVVAAGVGYASYRLYLILPYNTAPPNAEYPQAALDLLKMNFEINKIKSSDRDLFPFFLAGQMVRDFRPDQDMLESPTSYLIDLGLVNFWLSFWWTQKEVLASFLGLYRYGGYQWKGMEEAAQGFFGVSVKDLTLPEMAVLIVNIQAPYGLDPLCYKDSVEEDVIQLLEKYKKTFPEAQFDANQMFVRLRPVKCYTDRL